MQPANVTFYHKEGNEWSDSLNEMWDKLIELTQYANGISRLFNKVPTNDAPSITIVSNNITTIYDEKINPQLAFGNVMINSTVRDSIVSLTE